MVESQEPEAQLYQQAAEQGVPHAKITLAGCYKRGEGVVKSLERAVELYQQAADQGFEKLRCLIARRKASLYPDKATLRRK